jgi:phage repressor protein C with HTH and peptisase S24 domain
LTPIDATVKARLLRQAAANAPLWIEARGDSMGRTIPTGASVLVAEDATPRRGQLWAYCDEAGRVVVHRYRRHTGAGHVLQGDTRVHPDAPVQDGRLIGRVTAVRRRGRVRAVGWSDRCVGECLRLARATVARASRAARRFRRAA